MDHACDPCGTRWTPPTPSAFKATAGSVLLVAATCCALGMLWFLHRDSTTIGGGLGLASLASMGLGVKLRGANLARCPECGRLGYADTLGEGSDSGSE